MDERAENDYRIRKATELDLLIAREEIARWKENYQEMMESNTQHWEALGRANEEIARWKDMADKEHALAVQFATEREQQAEEIARLRAALEEITESDEPYDLAYSALRPRAQVKPKDYIRTVIHGVKVKVELDDQP